MGGSMGSEADTKTKAQKAVAIAAARKDCIAFVSAFKGNQVEVDLLLLHHNRKQRQLTSLTLSLQHHMLF